MRALPASTHETRKNTGALCCKTKECSGRRDEGRKREREKCESEGGVCKKQLERAAEEE
jgi:hypothetical protein